jgi:DNA/RNA-binding domain of Phe-tRNA-synthetase-like protein
MPSGIELEVQVSTEWHEQFPGAHVGMLVLDGVVNPSRSTALEERTREIETSLREQYAGMQRAELVAVPAIQAYQPHYRSFGQTYHVLRQLESVALKSKPLTSPSTLVLAMFAAELQSLLLTAGHDLASVDPPIVLDASRGGEQFVGIGGREQLLRPGDMLMHDGQGIISAVIYGPDQRTQLSEDTRAALFTTYAPAGIPTEAIEQHLAQIAALVRVVAPAATIKLRAIYP